MSPEYKSWREVDRYLQEAVKVKVGKKKIQQNLRGGFAVKILNQKVEEFFPVNELSETVLEDARKENSPWHWVHGQFNPKKNVLEGEKQNPPEGTHQGGRKHGRGSTIGKSTWHSPWKK